MRMFEQRFEGRANAGLRSRIREVVSGSVCGPEKERRVLNLASRIALTAQGKATLVSVARDYRSVGGDYNPRCDCAACLAGNLQRAGALG